jgi:hypothetical protein
MSHVRSAGPPRNSTPAARLNGRAPSGSVARFLPLISVLSLVPSAVDCSNANVAGRLDAYGSGNAARVR